MNKKEKERNFERTKHYASVVRDGMKWTSCYTSEDGSNVAYCVSGSNNRRTMTGEQIQSLGIQLEKTLCRKLKIKEVQG